MLGLCLIGLSANPARSQQTCFLVYEPGGPHVVHTRENWVAVAQQPTPGYRTPMTQCLTYEMALLQMDLIRISVGYVAGQRCIPWSRWRSVGPQPTTYTAAPSRENPGMNFMLDRNCGCCEQCMWEVDPAGTGALGDCRSFDLVSGPDAGARVIIDRNGQPMSATGVPINLPRPGQQPITLPAFPGQLGARGGDLTGRWDDAGATATEIVQVGDLLVLQRFGTQGGVVQARGRRQGNTIVFNWSSTATRGAGEFVVSGDGRRLDGWWTDRSGGRGMWVLTRPNERRRAEAPRREAPPRGTTPTCADVDGRMSPQMEPICRSYAAQAATVFTRIRTAAQGVSRERTQQCGLDLEAGVFKAPYCFNLRACGIAFVIEHDTPVKLRAKTRASLAQLATTERRWRACVGR